MRPSRTPCVGSVLRFHSRFARHSRDRRAAPLRLPGIGGQSDHAALMDVPAWFTNGGANAPLAVQMVANEYSCGGAVLDDKGVGVRSRHKGRIAATASPWAQTMLSLAKTHARLERIIQVVQKCFRGFKARLLLVRKREAITKLQAAERTRQHRWHHQRQLLACKHIQRIFRGFSARSGMLDELRLLGLYKKDRARAAAFRKQKQMQLEMDRVASQAQSARKMQRKRDEARRNCPGPRG